MSRTLPSSRLLAVPTTENEQVNDYKSDRFVQAGITVDASTILAISVNDWHQVLDAYAAGCSEELLLEIFS